MGIVDIQIEDGDEDTYFIKQKDSLFMIGGYCLRRIFSENEAYKKMNYNHFLYKIVEGNISINTLQYDDCFINKTVLSKGIQNEMKTIGLKDIVDKYCIRKDNRIIIKRGLSVSDRYTVIYHLWRNGYQYAYGDLSGEEYLIYQKEK